MKICTHSREDGKITRRSCNTYLLLTQRFVIIVLICLSAVTNDFLQRGLHLWKCLYLARNVPKVNNVLSQSTLIDLPAISPAVLDQGEQKATSSAGSLDLTSRLPPLLKTITSHGLSASLRWTVAWCSKLKAPHLNFTFYADNTTAELNVPGGSVCICRA